MNQTISLCRARLTPRPCSLLWPGNFTGHLYVPQRFLSSTRGQSLASSPVTREAPWPAFCFRESSLPWEDQEDILTTLNLPRKTVPSAN
ncbi:hypothetical protein DTO169E5_6982 [Paecilomyces variotii]|nr:hypothetical protein DTO169E5_6982 [Paecilomyces variotii]